MVLTAKSILVAVTLTCTALFSGALFGWATLQLIFEEDGVFSDGCENVADDELCDAQQNKFSLMYNISSTLMAFGSFFWGSFVDKMGPVWSSIVSCICVSTGLLLFGISGNEDVAGFILGAALLAVGGGFTLLNAFTLSYVLEQEHMALVMSSVNCLFDASGVTFLFVYLLYTHLNVSRLNLFVGMACLAFILGLMLIVLWWMIEPELKVKKKAVFEANMRAEESSELPSLEEGEGDDQFVNNEVDIDAAKEETRMVEVSPDEEPLSSGPVELTMIPLTGPDDKPKQGTRVGFTKSQPQKRKSSRTVLEKHSTPWLKETQSRAFIFGVIFGSAQFFRVNVMFGTILDVLKNLGDEDTGFLYTQIFVASLPLGFLSIPVITYFLKNYGLVHTFHFIIFLGCGYGGFLMIPVLELQLVTFLFFSFFRAFLFSVMAYFSVHRFGPINSGKLYGLTMSIAGFFNFLNYPMVLVVNKYWGGDYLYYNLIQFMLFLPLLLAVHHLLKPVVAKLDDICLVHSSSANQGAAQSQDQEIAE